MTISPPPPPYSQLSAPRHTAILFSFSTTAARTATESDVSAVMSMGGGAKAFYWKYLDMV